MCSVFFIAYFVKKKKNEYTEVTKNKEDKNEFNPIITFIL